jgi:transposase InsO family protein
MFYKVSGVQSTCQKPDWIKEYQVLRSDNRGEFMSNLFASFLKDHGVQHQLSIPYNPQQNGMAERLNQTIVESVWCMLHHAWTNAC